VSDAHGDELAIAAPPWAKDALAAIAEAGAVTTPLRHVVMDPRTEMPVEQGVRVLWRYHLRPQQLEKVVDHLPDLQWVHSDYVGVDDLPLAALARRHLMLSNGAGLSAGPIAEWVVLAVLLAAKQLPRFVRQSDAGTWDVGAPLAELRGAVALILGAGAIATAAARLLEPFGIEVRAAARRRRTTPPGVHALLVGEEWRSALPDADYVICTLPLTPATANLLDESVFSTMKPGAWLINVSRGAIVDEGALVAALDAGKLAGAVLDAHREEPLPATSPLWRRPDILVLPHVTWSSAHTLDDFIWRFAAQLRRFAGGQPPADLVDLDAGY
jgi:phosphoglycerate dehydrogenase-like enzyme